LRRLKTDLRLCPGEIFRKLDWREFSGDFVALSEDRSELAAGNIFSVVEATPAVQSLRRRLEEEGVLSLDAVSAAAQPFFAVLLARLCPGKTVVVITEGLTTQERFQQDIETWTQAGGEAGGDPAERSPSQENATFEVLFYPPCEVLPQEARLPHADVISDRLRALTALGQSDETARGQSKIVVTSVVALLQKTLPRPELARRTRRLQRGDSANPLDLVEWLEEQAYEPEAQVSQKGDMSLRGGILDLWPLTSAWPVRLEFFGNELESLRNFDPITQISREEIQAVTIPPGGELGILKKLQGEQVPIDAGDGTPGKAGLAQTTVQSLSASLLEHLSQGVIFVVCEPELVDEQARRYEAQVAAGDPLLVPWSQFQERMRQRGGVVAISQMEELFRDALVLETPLPSFDPAPDQHPQDSRIPAPDIAAPAPEASAQQAVFQSLEVFRPIGDRPPEAHIAEAQRKEFFGQLHRWARQDYAVQVFCNNDGERQRFQEVWWEYGLGNTNQLHLRNGALTRGFLFEPAKLVVVTDAEIFGRYKVQRPRRLKTIHAATSRSLLDINFSELEEGDYVVHLEHGIGRYLGLGVMPTRNNLPDAPPSHDGEECMVIEYGQSDPDQPPPKLYVPVSQAHLVGKYVGAGRARPPLNVLRGTRWAKAKAHAENAVRDLAGEMLRMQAARSSQPGHSFPADTGWQHEFENSFVYEETPDQMRAIVAAKKDMELPRPMDRLICGDVGYGKTEVAIRAAFKAALAGKQTALLVPTTILAQQHFNTFRERMADYPVRIELLSRFRTRSQQAEVVKLLAAGGVDIVIGTHRVLQSDVSFKDLGLVIIDEEQRFGVMHKDKLKHLRTMVDVLTLTATPIPRTLYLALAGARDMSTIETPPQDRLPVETIVTQYDERTIRDAIQRELNRGGQVFYLHNRVFDIDAVAHRLRTLVPQARIAVGHGQMESLELEEVMTQFVNGKSDVLLSTTIIESGLDIPNANTIIIDRADRFGLSDLYQLRGRVGRYKHQAYAYLLLPRHAGLLVDARKRLSAIKQYSTLGSGFKIAMRDLEIRGAGNLLGAEQSGHIAAVGFELYCQLLKQSVSHLQGQKINPPLEVDVRLDFLAQSPDENGFKAQTSNSGGLPASNPKRRGRLSKPKSRAGPDIIVPREVSTEVSDPGAEEPEMAARVTRALAIFPLDYIASAQQRIDVYRKLAQARDPAALRALKDEVRDRFGPLPAAAELLLKVAELKIIAAERGVSAIETRGNKLMLTRENDYVMTASRKFPRLTRTSASARLNEIKKLLTTVEEGKISF
jgi:transcription-repair coupling factor (superfamily II helicase)